MKQSIFAIAALCGLTACAEFDPRVAYAELPFENGAMSIITAEQGRMRTYRLVPCHQTIVCAGSERGRHGQVSTQGEFVVVRGLYGRTFYLSAGGDGVVERHGTRAPLAWDSVVVMVGE